MISRSAAERVSSVTHVYQVAADGDYVGTHEMPCPATPPLTANMAPVTCPILDSGATCTLTCKPGYVKSGDFVCSKGVWSAETCSEPEKYVAEEQLFRLSHRSRLDYGWKIRQARCYLHSVALTAHIAW